MLANLFGTTAENTYANDPRAIGFAAETAPGRYIKQPQSQRELFDRLASGMPLQLSQSDVRHVESLGVKLINVTDLVRESEAHKLLSQGVPIDIINAKTTEPHYRAEGVKITTGFRPAKY